MLKYEQMREVLDNRIPETIKTDRYAETEVSWGDREIPIYCYYETLEYLFIDLLNGDIKDDKLLERVLDFLEDMANSDDVDVCCLMVVQILEALFGLERDVFIRMEKMLRPKTSEELERIKYNFYVPNGYAPEKIAEQKVKKKKKKIKISEPKGKRKHKRR
jgi:hypothetical protein